MLVHRQPALTRSTYLRMSKYQTPLTCLARPLADSRFTIGWYVAIAIGDENTAYFFPLIAGRPGDGCRMRSAATVLDGNAKSYLLRSTEVAISREPAVSTFTSNPCLASAAFTS